MDDPAFIENHKIKKIRKIVDSALVKIKLERLYGREAWKRYDEAKERVLSIFPGDEELFEHIYFPRFSRVIWENMLLALEGD